MQIRKAKNDDLKNVLNLYDHLHKGDKHTIKENTLEIWQTIINTDNIFMLVGDENGEAVATCILVVVPNLTHDQRPYALIENVVTHPKHRRKGFASQILEEAKQLAISKNCYKLMLMTSSKEPEVLDFYRNAGYNSEDKTAFVQWL